MVWWPCALRGPLTQVPLLLKQVRNGYASFHRPSTRLGIHSAKTASSPQHIPRTLVTQNLSRPISTVSTTILRRKFIPSPEQLAVVELCRTQNVIVSARPGAGKTATAEAIIAANPNKPIAVITYSKRLKLDTARRLDIYPEQDVFTFHGLAGRLFSTIVFNDSILSSLRKSKDAVTWTGRPYEIVILDELQDCTDDLFWLICTFLSAVTNAAGGRAPQLVVLGDERQTIYGFRGADSRYLSFASSAMATLSPYPWTHLALSKSFRLSHENCAFVNEVFLGGEQYIIGSHSGPKPLYLVGNIFDPKSIAQQIFPLVHQYGPERVAILAPSVLKSLPIQLLSNYLVEVHGVPLARPLSDDMPLDDQVLQGKLCVSTYHQFKGNERDVVIVYGIQASYFAFFARDLPDDTCPNTIFVALTRACQQLVIVHDNRKSFMSFVELEDLSRTSSVVNLGSQSKPLNIATPGRPLELGLTLPLHVSASELPRHVLDAIIEDACAKHLEINKTLPSSSEALHIKAPSIILTDSDRKHYEAVSDLNGLAVVAAYEIALMGTLTTLGSSLLKVPSENEAQAVWLCREACTYEARVSGYNARELQMRGHPFDWLVSYLDRARDRLEAQFPAPAELKFEVKLQDEVFGVADPSGGEPQSTCIHGRADIVQFERPVSTSVLKSTKSEQTKSIAIGDPNQASIWEIKFVTQLSSQHVIQACVYGYLWSQEHKLEAPPRIILFNVRNGEKWEIKPLNGVASLRSVVEEMLIAKYSKQETLTTEEFLKRCAKTRKEVILEH